MTRIPRRFIITLLFAVLVVLLGVCAFAYFRMPRYAFVQDLSWHVLHVDRFLGDAKRALLRDGKRLKVYTIKASDDMDASDVERFFSRVRGARKVILSPVVGVLCDKTGFNPKSALPGSFVAVMGRGHMLDSPLEGGSGAAGNPSDSVGRGVPDVVGNPSASAENGVVDDAGNPSASAENGVVDDAGNPSVSAENGGQDAAGSPSASAGRGVPDMAEDNTMSAESFSESGGEALGSGAAVRRYDYVFAENTGEAWSAALAYIREKRNVILCKTARDLFNAVRTYKIDSDFALIVDYKLREAVPRGKLAGYVVPDFAEAFLRTEPGWGGTEEPQSYGGGVPESEITYLLFVYDSVIDAADPGKADPDGSSDMP